MAKKPLTSVKTRNGRGVRIFRNQRTVKGVRSFDAQWTFRPMVFGKYVRFQLPKARVEAERIADEIDYVLRRTKDVDAAKKLHAELMAELDEKAGRAGSRIVEVAKKPEDRISIGRMLTEFEKRVAPALNLAPATVKKYMAAFALQVRTVRAFRAGKKSVQSFSGCRGAQNLEDIRLLPLSTLDRAFANDYRVAVAQKAGKKGVDSGAVKRSANSVIASARGLFSDEAVDFYSFEVPVPVREWKSAKLFRKVGKAYQIPETETILRVFHGDPERKLKGIDWLRNQEPNAYRLFLLTFGSGMRKKDATHARYNWFVPITQIAEGKEKQIIQVWLRPDADYETKGRRSDERTEMVQWAYDELMKLRPEKSSAKDYVIVGTQTDRLSETSRVLNKYLRERGLDRNKPTHELRGLFGTYIANSRSLFDAQKLLRHSDPKITSDHYADRILDSVVTTLWESCPAELQSTIRTNKKQAG